MRLPGPALDPDTRGVLGRDGLPVAAAFAITGSAVLWRWRSSRSRCSRARSSLVTCG